VPRWARAFEDFLRLETAVPLLVDHGALIDSRDVIADIGTGAPFAALTSPLPGLLCLGDVGRADGHGDQLLYDIELMLQQTWPPGREEDLHRRSDDGGRGPRKAARGESDGGPARTSVMRVLAIGPDELTIWKSLTADTAVTHSETKLCQNRHPSC
jgi:hypothetical protein